MRVHRRVLARPEPRVEHPHLIILKKKLVVLGGSRSAVIDSNAIMSNILVIRSHGVLLDSDLGALYQVETKAPTRAVRRNAGRFPGDFMFPTHGRGV